MIRFLIAGAFGLLVSLNSPAQSSAGSLDGDFGTQGRLVIEFGSQNDIYDNAYLLTTRSDGSDILVGIHCDNCSNPELVLLNYDRFGQLKTDFGTNGVTRTNFQFHFGPEPFAAVHLRNGGFVVAMNDDHNFYFFKFSDFGVIDTSFGVNGMLTVSDIPGGLLRGMSLVKALDNEGYFLGGVLLSPEGYRPFVWKLSASFLSDRRFGSGGYVTLDPIKYSESTHVFPDDGGRILVFHSISSAIAVNSSGFAMTRLMADGSIDASFAVNGSAVFASNSYGITSSNVLQQRGDFIVSSPRCMDFVNSIEGLCAVRMHDDGTSDQNFGTAGFVFRASPLGWMYRGASALDSSGRILLATTVYGKPDVNIDRYPTVLRLLPNGQEDVSFGDNGLASFRESGSVVYDIKSDAYGIKVVGTTTQSLSGHPVAFFARLVP